MADPLRYYVAEDDGGFAETSTAWMVPPGFTEVSKDEYDERLAAQRQIAEQRTADAAGDGGGNTT